MFSGFALHVKGEDLPVLLVVARSSSVFLNVPWCCSVLLGLEVLGVAWCSSVFLHAPWCCLAFLGVALFGSARCCWVFVSPPQCCCVVGSHPLYRQEFSDEMEQLLKDAEKAKTLSLKILEFPASRLEIPTLRKTQEI